RIGYVHRQIVVGVATTGVDEAHRSAAQVELDRVPHAMGGGNQGWFGRTRVVLGPLDEDVLVDLAAFVCPDVGAWESDRAQAVVEVCVGDDHDCRQQGQVGDRCRELRTALFVATGVHDQRALRADDEPQRLVQLGVAAGMDPVGQGQPAAGGGRSRHVSTYTVR